MKMAEEMAGLPQDVQDVMALREYVSDMRTKKGLVVDLLDAPPLHVPGCDDVNYRFDWYRIDNKDGVTLGYFHTVKGVDL